MLLMYLPLAAEGLERTMAPITVVALSISFCGSKLSLPTGTCTSADAVFDQYGISRLW